ncbi:MAG: Fic family protein [Phycisphaerae bacterium]|nr:Fic family protein [Phycisphaerae bacterium]
MKPGFKPEFRITHAVTTALTTIERAQGFIEAATLSEEWIQQMGARALILEAHHTTHIEGTQLTLEQSERLWAGEDVPDVDPDDKRELLNYRQAFDLVSGYLNSGSLVTEGLIREIHKCLVEGVRGGKAAPGEYRKVQNHVVNALTQEIIYTPPEAYEVPRLVQELVDWINQNRQVHPVLVSGIAQFQLVHIHPFLDGNGGTSRLLSTLCLYRAGYDFKRLFTISEYYDRDRPAFHRAIQSVREHNMDLTGWLDYFVEGLATQMQEVRDRGETVIRMNLLAGEYGLTERQQGILQLFLEQDTISINTVQAQCPQAHRRTLQRDLKVLLEKDLIDSKGE